MTEADDSIREFLAISKKEIWEEARDRQLICANRESKDRPRAKIEILFREGEGHWDSDVVTTMSEDLPELTINLTDALCQRVENNMGEQERSGKAHPVGDGGDVDVAEIINGLLRHVETRSEAWIAYAQARKSAVTHGWGYFRLIAEWEHERSMRKDLRILPIRNVFTVYMDPDAIMPSGSDQRWCEIITDMAWTEYKARYRNAATIPWTSGDRADLNTGWYDKEKIRLAEYFRIREKLEKLWGLRNIGSGEERTLFESELPKDLSPSWKKEGSRDSLRRAVEWFRINGQDVVDRAQLPGEYIPIFRVEGNAVDVDGVVTRRGMIKSMMDPQRMVDYGETAKIKRLGLTPQSPWVAAEGQLDGHPEWDDDHVTARKVLTYKPVTIQTSQGEVPLPPPSRQPPAGIEQGFAEFVQGMRTNLLAVAGVPNEPGADKQGQVVSGIALDKRQLLSDQSHLQYAKNEDSAVTQCARVVVSWIPAYFNEPNRVQRIIGADSKPQLVTLNKRDPNDALAKVLNDVSVGRYDVVLSTGASFETKRQEGAENLIELLKIEPLAEIIAKTAPDLVFRSIDHPYMQEIADRLMAETPEGLEKIMAELPERARNIIQAMAKQNQNLQQALQQAQQEMKTGLAKAHLQATVKAHDVEESNKTKRIDTLVRADTELKKEEIAGGVQLLVKHLEHSHDERMAEKEAQNMINRGESHGNNGTGQ
jgi:Phage P22-like portal protein